jgi:hypothetical protein
MAEIKMTKYEPPSTDNHEVISLPSDLFIEKNGRQTNFQLNSIPVVFRKIQTRR